MRRRPGRDVFFERAFLMPGTMPLVESAVVCLGEMGDAFWDRGERRSSGGDVVEIEERLALSHEDDVGVGLERVFVFFERDEDLRDDFCFGSEVADEAELRGEAELAIDGTAGLCGDADGLAAVAGHEDGFDAGGAGGGAVVAAAGARMEVGVTEPSVEL